MPLRTKAAMLLGCLGLAGGCSKVPGEETGTTLLTTFDDDEADMDDESESGDESDAGSTSTDDADDADSSTSSTSTDGSTSTDDDTTSTSTSTTDTNDDTTTTTTTGEFGNCGWDAGNMYYECGFEGEDPGGEPIECPPGLVENEPCAVTGITGVGCCTGLGNWYCGQGEIVVFNPC